MKFFISITDTATSTGLNGAGPRKRPDNSPGDVNACVLSNVGMGSPGNGGAYVFGPPDDGRPGQSAVLSGDSGDGIRDLNTDIAFIKVSCKQWFILPSERSEHRK